MTGVGGTPESENRVSKCNEVTRAVWGVNILYLPSGSSLVVSSEVVWRVVWCSGGNMAIFSDTVDVSESPKGHELFSIGLYHHHKCCLPGEPGVASSGGVSEVELTWGRLDFGSFSESGKERSMSF